MWKVTVRTPDGEPKVYELKPGINSIGRLPGSDIYIPDVSASRHHAEIIYDADREELTLRDLGSINGTFVNQRRITASVTLSGHDTVRIGNCILTPVHYVTGPKMNQPFYGTHPFTRDLLIEALDHHAVLLSEAARELNSVTDMDTALKTVTQLMRRAMGADKCEVILAERFTQLHALGFPESIARAAIEQRSAVVIPDMMALNDQDVKRSAYLYHIRSALCVPVISGDEILGLIYMYKTSPETRPFEQGDMELSVAISHQAALTIQRTRLFTDLQRQREMQHLLRRFLSPREADYLLKDYLEHGILPGLEEKTMTILFADLEDSTELAEYLGARQFGMLLARFYQETSAVVFNHQGLIKLLGDGIMAVFSEAEGQTSPEDRAILAGFEIIRRVQALGNVDGNPNITLGVSINSGVVMAGYVGNDERVEYAVLGDPANVAYRLQAFARPNRVVLGPATAAAMQLKYPLKPLDEVHLRGREKPVQIFEVFQPKTMLLDELGKPENAKERE